MGDHRLDSVVRQVRRLVGGPGDDRLADADLLRRFADGRDEAAFAALVRRYGGLVWGVCRRTLPSSHDAEDAFQATFLVLTRHAPGLTLTGSLGGWLYEVAYHVALKARSRHRPADGPALPEVPDMRHDDPADAAGRRELCAVLDEELNRLPDGFRRAVVLCDLLGRTHPEAAAELGVQPKAVGKRLRKARELLRVRLARRGVAVASAGLAAVLQQEAAAGGPSPAVAAGTVDAAVAYAAGGLTGGAAALAGRVLVATPGPAKAALAAVAVLLAAGAAGWSVWPAAVPPAVAAPRSPLPPPGDKPPAPRPAAGPRAVAGAVVGPDGTPVDGATVAVLARRVRPGERGDRPDLLAVAASDPGGAFTAAVPAGPGDAGRTDLGFLVAVPGRGGAPPLVAAYDPADWSSAPIRLVVRPAVPLTGRVVDPGGAPASGLTIRVLRVSGLQEPVRPPSGDPPPPVPGWPAEARTDGDGRFALAGLPPGAGLALSLADGAHAPETVWVPDPGRVPAELVYRRADPRAATGRVVAADTGRPVPGARVAAQVLTGGPDRAVNVWVDGVADADGRFRLPLPLGRVWAVAAAPPAGRPLLPARLPLEEESPLAPLAPVEVKLPRGVTAAGRVEAAGRGVAGAVVRFVPDAVGDDPAGRPTAVTDAAGRFRLGLPAAAGRLVVTAPSAGFAAAGFALPDAPGDTRRYAHAVVPLTPAADELAVPPIRLDPVPDTPVRFERPDGSAAAGAVAVVRPRPAADNDDGYHERAAADGTLAVAGLRPGRRYPALVWDRASGAGAVAELAAAADAPGGRVTVRLLPGREATARVRTADGSPFPGRRVRLAAVLPADRPFDGRPADGSASIDARWFGLPAPAASDPQGLVRLTALIPGATYRLTPADWPGRPVTFTVPLPNEPPSPVPDLILDNP